ncbi:MAG: DNA methyltransferase [Nitrospinota bacterium]
MLSSITELDDNLTNRFSKVLEVNPEINRTLVSFQANKSEKGHRWCKYKEAFSAPLVNHILNKVEIKEGKIFDPFAGSGTALFVASELGFETVGIELLPNSVEAIEARRLISESDREWLVNELRRFMEQKVWEKSGKKKEFSHLRITSGAFPANEEKLLCRYLYEIELLPDKRLTRILRFASLCVLEKISFTRKDGQYLRWDSRSGRRTGGKLFHKGPIPGFTEAITEKINEIARDVKGEGLLFFDSDNNGKRGSIELLKGSCHEILPTIKANSFNGIITSPPYCNRYDYTRTYALELAFLGVDELTIRKLRQNMLSCTVENRDKESLNNVYSLDLYKQALKAFHSQKLLKRILNYLEECKKNGSLNNNGIPRMVKNYFKELTLVIFECARVLKPGAPLVMVNDNVRYQGAHIPVDLILSDLAEKAGFVVEKIWVLPRGKGNSSQQMGLHGRKELRKCIYIWRLRDEQAKLQGQQAAYEKSDSQQTLAAHP